jgi:hypothetical protein
MQVTNGMDTKTMRDVLHPMITVVYPRIVYTDVNRFIGKIWVPSLARRA